MSGKEQRLASVGTDVNPLLVLREQENLNDQILKDTMLPPPLSFPSGMSSS